MGNSWSLSILLQWLGGLSLLTFAGSLLFVPLLISRMGADYFIRHRQQVEERHRQHPVLALIIFFLRNIIGVGLLVAGAAMLLLPGQGILTILIGISLMDFPGKHRMLERLIQIRQVQRALNWIRKKEKKPPFVFK